ncbi:hypothetical protein TWF225_007690 [Orbilia oligospora]|uniref:Uncharacterized protein n=1 Tax=Orbilia oligospora TaxID=2813651 RepID=A0A7C8P341_ORBOL|nr:hypothetical protein TWF751_001112 [Orbilia oligospora]KAF3179158.1 hypothetical protein TWF225_007690 [Orbilia oligospora]KAF3233074.1 hypothetical protein TWF128_003283 [Orbilia oligospora]KAF3233075.1 hypothetical protein TWF128_003283 [Orbilia oligospora]KAF3246791.1 hypothetical protein TWF217_009814 [Orbilia oligospora]
MPRKAFVADLQQVQSHSPHPSVSCIEKGEDDGSFTFKVADGTLPIEITVLIPELSDYPSEHECFLYATAENVPESISKAIENINARAKKIADIISITATAICSKRGIKRQHSTEYDPEYDDDSMDIDEDEEEQTDQTDEYYDEGDFGDSEEDGSIAGWSTTASENGLAIGDSQVAGSTDPLQCECIKEFCLDLRAVKSAGFKVGVLGNLPGGSGYLAISIRISKLGISDEAMTAWRLNPDKYLVLLMHYPSGYKPLSAMAKDSYTAKKWVQVYVGTSSRYKPSLQEAIAAFTKVKKFKEDQDGNLHVFKSEGGKLDVHGLSDSQVDANSPIFEGTFISRPVSELLNERLLALTLYRVSYGFGWDGSEMFYEDFQGRERSDIIDDIYYKKDDEGIVNLAPLVQADILQSNCKSHDDIPFPLVAMQYMLRHFVRCTEFCLVCHNKIDANFEALKPYVCSKPLCLYQYMALGFGPSMEYEILDQPSVIDLLISFCWVSASHGKLSEFPTGLNLVVPMPGFSSGTGNFDRSQQELSADVMEGNSARLNTGDWIIMTSLSGSESLHCRVVDGDYFPKVRLAIAASNPHSIFYADSGKDVGIIEDMKIQVSFTIYDRNFDELSDGVKRNSIVQMLETLPSVNEMREWLIMNTKVGEEVSLKTWRNKISPSALLLLRWIVASNRSCIVQIDQTPDDPMDYKQGDVPPDVASSAMEETKEKKKIILGEERVHGMDGWIQFRFAMGAPDKEQRFVNEVRSTVETNALAFPTIFAFHGSPLPNWHSIIREGLHFRETAHGRAYGHGVYHSLDASVSLGYTNSYRNYNANGIGSNNQKWWSKSHLCINSAMCLNEVVNLPNEFVSKSPHLVVDKVDWIQTRYLFVQTGRPPTALSHNPSVQAAPIPLRTLPQDPGMTPRGINQKTLVIPETASTVRTRSGNNQTVSQPKPSPAKKSRIGTKIKGIVKRGLGSTGLLGQDDDGYSSCATDQEDRDILSIDEKAMLEGQNTSLKGKEKQIAKTKNPNAFIPGNLAIGSIQLLAEPSYASPLATKRINQELRALVKIQECHELEELGWYINRDSIENVYQWIVEFHSFDPNLPLAKDMVKHKVNSIVMEVRFGKDFPMTPPFFRIIGPRFLPFQRGGGGHVTAGGALCMELLTNSGWSAVSSLESVFLQIRLALCSVEPNPARLEAGGNSSYSPHEAKDAFIRACRTHGWQVPPDFNSII